MNAKPPVGNSQAAVAAASGTLWRRFLRLVWALYSRGHTPLLPAHGSAAGAAACREVSGEWPRSLCCLANLRTPR
mgnify:CR=1 FL=1